MAGAARWGLKRVLVVIPYVNRYRLNGRGRPLGFETDVALLEVDEVGLAKWQGR